MNKDSDQSTREAAYFLWENEGQPAGKDLEHWERALGIEDEAILSHRLRDLKQQLKDTPNQASATAISDEIANIETSLAAKRQL
jgi:Protein of unknown function (DUF2934)